MVRNRAILIRVRAIVIAVISVAIVGGVKAANADPGTPPVAAVAVDVDNVDHADGPSIAPAASHHAVPATRADEQVVERYPDGKVKIERQVTLNDREDFVNNGLFRAYDRGGSLLGVGHYRMGVRYGQWQRVLGRNEGNIFANGADRGFTPPFRSMATFDDGMLHGDWTISDSKGQVITQWHFEHGEREGVWIWFKPDGSVREQITYENGHIAADIVASDGEEKFKVVRRYLDGRALDPVVEWYSRGRKQSEGHVLRPREITRVDVDWWNAIVKTTAVRNEEQNDRHGQWQFWHPNGKLRMQGTYDRGTRVGLFAWWHANGQKAAEGVYLDDEPHGAWQTWHASGARQSHGEYANGNRIGPWLSWHDNGMRKFEGDYANGVLTDEARAWDDKGKRIPFEGTRSQYAETVKAAPKVDVDAERARLSEKRVPNRR